MTPPYDKGVWVRIDNVWHAATYRRSMLHPGNHTVTMSDVYDIDGMPAPTDVVEEWLSETDYQMLYETDSVEPRGFRKWLELMPYLSYGVNASKLLQALRRIHKNPDYWFFIEPTIGEDPSYMSIRIMHFVPFSSIEDRRRANEEYTGPFLDLLSGRKYTTKELTGKFFIHFSWVSINQLFSQLSSLNTQTDEVQTTHHSQERGGSTGTGTGFQNQASPAAIESGHSLNGKAIIVPEEPVTIAKGSITFR